MEVIVARAAGLDVHKDAVTACVRTPDAGGSRSQAPGRHVLGQADDGAWSLPKGEYGEREDPFEVAVREFREEFGMDPPPDRPAVSLGALRQPGGKLVSAWTLEGDLDVHGTEQHVHHGVAARLRNAPGVPGGRPG